MLKRLSEQEAEKIIMFSSQCHGLSFLMCMHEESQDEQFIGRTQKNLLPSLTFTANFKTVVYILIY